LQEIALPVFARDLEKSLFRCFEMAKEQRFKNLTVEHLLLALLDDKDAVNMLSELNIDLNGLKNTVTTYIENPLSTPQMVLSENPSKAPIMSDLERSMSDVERAVARASWHAMSAGIEVVDGPRVLLFILSGRAPMPRIC
jgi:ATP-dependent Clp protease ATP-binding subunit ClpA